MEKLTFKTRLKNLSFQKKAILLGALLLIVGTCLPWYKDLDKYGVGDTFLGITGPMYLSGIVVLTLSVMSFAFIIMRMMQSPVKWLPVAEEHFHLFTAGFSLFLLVLTNSVYFHVKFGMNLTDKSMGIGMMLAFGGVAIIGFGALLDLRRQKEQVFQGHMDHLDEISTTKKRRTSASTSKVSEASIDQMNNLSPQTTRRQQPVANQDKKSGVGHGMLDVAKETLNRQRRANQTNQIDPVKTIQKDLQKDQQLSKIVKPEDRKGTITKRPLPKDEKLDRFQTIEERLKEYHLKNANNDRPNN